MTLKSAPKAEPARTNIIIKQSFKNRKNLPILRIITLEKQGSKNVKNVQI